MDHPPDQEITVCLTGDVMTGRGIDQILPHPSEPTLQEGYVKDARDYVDLAIRANGAIDFPVGWDYVWGDARASLTAAQVCITNLETSVTRSDRFWTGKRIHYRMHPDNAACLNAAGIDCCVLANNHVMDWDTTGLEETLATLQEIGIVTAGAGPNRRAAAAPAELRVAVVRARRTER